MTVELRKPIIGIKAERRAAFLAYLGEATALQNRPSPVLEALRAYEVRGIRCAVRISECVYEFTFWRFVKAVSIKLALRALSLCETEFEIRKRQLELSICELRIAYLQGKIRERGFDIGVCTTLRRLQKISHFVDGSDNGAEGTCRLPYYMRGAVNDIDKAAHAVASLAQFITDSRATIDREIEAFK